MKDRSEQFAINGARALGLGARQNSCPIGPSTSLIFLNVGINGQALLTLRGANEDWSKTMKQIALRKFAIATSTIAFAALFTVGWSVENAQARRLYVTPYYHYHPFNPYVADQSGLSWYAVRAYYNGGPWCGVAGGVGYGYGPGLNNWTCYSGWNDYKSRNGIGCDPGTLIKGGDGIVYVCQ